jgi:hypothetical protein
MKQTRPQRHKQQHHRPSLELHALAAKFIFLLAQHLSNNLRGEGVMWEPPTLSQEPANLKVADVIC